MCGIDAISSIWNGFDFSYIIGLLMGVIPALICITLHELSHGCVAYLLGDNTAKDRGRLTLNPLKHLDVMGLLMLVVFHVGWAKPVPVNMSNFREPKRGMALTALAGPVSNLLISVVFLFLYGAFFDILSGGKVGEYILQMLMLTGYISIGYAVFNLIPVPPLDGSKVLLTVLSDKAYYTLMRYERYGMIVLFLLVSTGLLGQPLSNAIGYVFEKLWFIAQAGFDFVHIFS